MTYFPKRIESLSDKRPSPATADAPLLFMTGDGKVIAVGRWTDGRCGVRCANAASDGYLEEPKFVEDLSVRATKIVVRRRKRYGIGRGRLRRRWGSQYMGQLGLGPREEDAHVPEKMQYTKPMAGKVFADLSFGGQHTAAVLAESVIQFHAREQESSHLVVT